MLTTLSIALLIVGAGSTFCAFGGKTWTEGTEPLIDRITGRGWISLVLLLTALSIGVCKEIYSAKSQAEKDTASEQNLHTAKADADRKQAELQNKLQEAKSKIDLANQKLETSNVKIEGMKELLAATQDQITGGKGFPIAIVTTVVQAEGGGYPLWVMPSGDTPLYDVNFNVIEGAYHPPTQEERTKMEEQANKLASGDLRNYRRTLGQLDPKQLVPLGYTIHPSVGQTNTYRILFAARNGMVLQTLEVKFNAELGFWQSRYNIRSQSPDTPNKVVRKQGWEPKIKPMLLVGDGPPHNRR